MKNKWIFRLYIIVVLGFILVGCATTDTNAPPPYDFEGTTWTKTENYELVIKGSTWEVLYNSKPIIPTPGTNLNPWKVEGNTLTFGDDTWIRNGGHAAGVWTLKSGVPSATNLDGTTWIRTAVLELSFANQKMIVKDGNNSVNADAAGGDPYRVSGNTVTIIYGSGNTRGNYIVDGNTLTVTTNGQFGVSRLESGPWTKK